MPVELIWEFPPSTLSRVAVIGLATVLHSQASWPPSFVAILLPSPPPPSLCRGPGIKDASSSIKLSVWILGWRFSSQADVASCLHLPSLGLVLLYLAFMWILGIEPLSGLQG